MFEEQCEIRNRLYPRRDWLKFSLVGHRIVGCDELSIEVLIPHEEIAKQPSAQCLVHEILFERHMEGCPKVQHHRQIRMWCEAIGISGFCGKSPRLFQKMLQDCVVTVPPVLPHHGHVPGYLAKVWIQNETIVEIEGEVSPCFAAFKSCGEECPGPSADYPRSEPAQEDSLPIHVYLPLRCCIDVNFNPPAASCQASRNAMTETTPTEAGAVSGGVEVQA